MTRQTKLIESTVGMVLLSVLLSVSVTDAATGNTVNPAGVEPRDLPAAGAPAPTTVRLEALRQNGKQQAAEAAFKLAVEALERNDFAVAQTLIRDAIQLQPSNPGYLQGAAGVAFLQGELAEAEAYQVRSLELARTALGTDDIRVARLMDDLGTIYLARRFYTQADRTWRESLAIHERVLGNSDPSLAPRLTDLAGLAMHTGRFEESEALLKRALQIMQEGYGEERKDIATALHNLADFYIDQQRAEEAEVLYREALDVWKTCPAQQRLQVASDLNELGHAYLAQRRLTGAGTQFELVIKLLEDDFGRDHRYVQEARAALDKLHAPHDRAAPDEALFELLRDELSRYDQGL